MTDKDLLKAISIIVKKTVQETVKKEMKYIVTEMLKPEPHPILDNTGTGNTRTGFSTILTNQQDRSANGTSGNIMESLIQTAKPIPQGEGGSWPTLSYDTNDVHSVANGMVQQGQPVDKTATLTAPGGTFVDKSRVPEKVAQNINKDYSALMAKLKLK